MNIAKNLSFRQKEKSFFKSQLIISIAFLSGTFHLKAQWVDNGTVIQTDDNVRVVGQILSYDANDYISMQAYNANNYSRITWGDNIDDRLAFFYNDWNGSSNDLEVMSLLPNGRVGIGTTAPNGKLHIYKSTTGNSDASIAIDGPVNSERAIIFRDSGSDAWWFGRDNTGDMNNGIGFWRSGVGFAFGIMDNGNVGIGTSNPTRLLEISGTDPVFKIDAINTSGNAEIFFDTRKDNGDNYNTARIIADGGSGGQTSTLNFQIIDGDGSGWNNTLTLKSSAGSDPSGNVGIGTTTPDEKLTVKGKIHTEEVKVDLSVPAPDYVFADNYQLTTLEELEAFIKSNHHLPEVPSAKEMEANGVELGTMNMLLLKKIEELTLYLIQQQSINRQLSNRISKLENSKK